MRDTVGVDPLGPYDFVHLLHGEHPFGHALLPQAGPVQSIELVCDEGLVGVVVLRVDADQVWLLGGRFQDGNDFVFDALGAEVHRAWPGLPVKVAEGADFQAQPLVHGIWRQGVAPDPHEQRRPTWGPDE
jgi:hypothetical protein